MLVFAIKDVKVGFMSPFIRQNKELAIRDFKDALVSPSENNLFRLHPEDYELWQIGEFNQESGILTSKIEHLFSAIVGDSNA